ncbi:TPA: hypothetical protein SI321_000130 [Escherichia coli]|nr:hypothetical protein [Escherichia coli]HEI3181429.1 hypothetical protein [Escherichia coli]HEI3297619.1 hypothetical protein [Escherichia coli]
MKKTLIALAVAASAVVSGSAMAIGWEQNGHGNSVELGGTLTPVAKVTPWEVKTGDAVTNLDAQIQKGQKTVTIGVNQAIPVLGIRAQTTGVFHGADGISPQLDYDGAVDVNGFSAGVTTLTLDVTDAGGAKIGNMTVPFSAAAARSYSTDNVTAVSNRNLYATTSGNAFFGGLGKSSSAIASDAKAFVSAIDADVVAKYQSWNISSVTGALTDNFTGDVFYSAFYGSGIEKGKNITITFDQAVTDDTQVQWKASLPITVTYM